METEATGLDKAILATALSIDATLADTLLTNQRWLEATLRVMAADRFGLRILDEDTLEFPTGGKIVFTVLKKSLVLMSFAARERDAEALFETKFRTEAVGALIASPECFYFVESSEILEWHQAGTLQKGAMKLEKFKRLATILAKA